MSMVRKERKKFFDTTGACLFQVISGNACRDLMPPQDKLVKQFLDGSKGVSMSSSCNLKDEIYICMW